MTSLAKPDGPGAALAARGLVVRRGRTDVVREVDLSVPPGEIVAVLGPNGAGKSTLIAALGGMLRLRAGTIERGGKVATVLQTPALAARTARANVELALAWSHAPHSRRRARAEEALTRMRAAHLADRPARSLSGGEQRRVHLARAVAVAPAVMLLDEPFDGLDPESHLALRDDTADALRAGGSAVVAVLHERADAWAMADRIAVMLHGRLCALGPPQDVLEHPPSADVARFLGFDGELRTGSTVLLTRPAHVRVDAAGDIEASVVRTIVTEDGLRVRLQTQRGDVWSRYPGVDLRVGDTVRVALAGGASFES